MPVLCPGCGAVSPESDAVCPTCGGDLADDPVALVASDIPAMPHRPRARVERPSRARLRVVAAAVTVVVLFAVAAVVVWRATSNGDRPTRDAEWVATAARLPTLRGPAVRVLGLGGTRSVVRMADLTTGRVRELRVAGAPLRATNVFSRRGAILVQTFGGRVLSVRDTNGARARVVDLGRVDAVALSTSPDRVWLARGRALTEVRTDGHVVARVRMPAGWMLAGGGLDGDRVALAGTTDATSAVWDPRVTRFLLATRSAPALAASGHLVVSSECPTGSRPCRPYVSDLVAPATRPLAAPTWDRFEQPALPALVSPDGRYVAFGSAFPGHHDVTASIIVVDTRDGTVAWRHAVDRSSSEPVAWDAEGRLVFFTDGVDAFVHHLESDDDADDNVTLGPLRVFAPLAVIG